MTKETAFKAVIAEIPAQLDLDQMDVLNRKVDQMLRLMDDQVHLQKVSLLEAGHMLRFNGPKGRRISLSLPDAQDDYVQRVILRTRSFYEVRLLATVEAMGIVGKDSVVCDVGANIGNHTIYFGTFMGAAKVLAFESQAHCHETLCANIALNGLEDRVDEAVDSNDLARLDLIKIDVEGMQMAVLAGATGILEQRRPALWIELLARAGMAGQATTFLAKFGYEPSPIGLNDVIFRV